jgi:Flp pilus assembly CpaF family ATPase
MQGTWRSFCTDMDGAVRATLGPGRSPPEIAYAIGELVHNYFRTRGLTLTSYELRRLVAELLERHAGAREQGEQAQSGGLVSFAAEPAATPWAGDDPAEPLPAVAVSAFEAPPSALVSLRPREAAEFDWLLARVIEAARPRLLPVEGRRLAREAERRAVDAAIDEVLHEQEEAPPAQTRQRLAMAALSELCGAGLIDRLWADRSVAALFVNGPKAVFVERHGVIEPAAETFRDEAHLFELMGRLVRRPPTGAVEFKLRDGGSGTLIFPPVAPAGPVLALRRGEPGLATLEQLVSLGALAPPMADLLRLAARARLNVLVSGAEGSGKTPLLAAVARAFDGAARVVTLARHRHFRWTAPTKVELVASPGGASYQTLLAAAERLRSDLLVLDSLEVEDIAALAERLRRGEQGTLAAVAGVLAAGLARSVDLVARLERGRDGRFRVVSLEDATGAAIFVQEGGRFLRRTVEPAFSAILRERGYEAALASILR